MCLDLQQLEYVRLRNALAGNYVVKTQQAFEVLVVWHTALLPEKAREDEETHRIMIRFHDGDNPMALPVLLFMLPLLPPILLYIRKEEGLKRKRRKQN